ncbi:MAG: phosphoribosylformylglycinamidine synthase [Desulfitibacter sp. BRH_c19]|nr:MAG: phosphoribosylformylglycinamidine synthase [Desulfitibacter sp. BRH_c19]
MKFGIVVFPGSNCDADVKNVLDEVVKQETSFIWHKDTFPKNLDCVVLPGGFSYGDYLRTGSIARFSPVMDGVLEYASKGGLVLGICNGFQVLTEAGLLPGVLRINKDLKFICKPVYLKVENTNTPFSNTMSPGDIFKVPIAHGEGNYYVTSDELEELEQNNQIIFRYCTSDGKLTDAANPNGSINNIAGIINKEGNVLGMMPHPERCSESILGNEDGIKIFQSIINWWQGRS